MSDLEWLKRATDDIDASRRKTDVKPDPGPLTYEPHFGLREKAFSLLPSPRFFHRNSSNGAAFDDLLGGIRRREGILALTGEVGTGKTTLCRAVLAALDRKTFAAFVPDPIVSRQDLLMTLLVDFGVVSVDEIRAGHLRSASRTELAYPLHDFLTALQPLKGFAVVMIDEAQGIPSALLEEIRILSDMENGQKLLQLLLIGQPELDERLATPEMRQLTQRLTVRCELPPLAREDVGPYITHRLAVAGRSEPLFRDGDYDLIWKTSHGIPRVVNLLCDRALARAGRAGAAMVAADDIVGAAKELKLSPLLAGAWPSESRAPGPSGGPVTTPSTNARRVRQGLPSDYRMRHDAHYVDELTSRRGVAPAIPSSPLVEKDVPIALQASRTLPPFDSELDEASKAELQEFEKSAHEAEVSRRRLTRVAALFTVVTIVAAAGTWIYLSSSAAPDPQPRVQSAPTSTTGPAVPAAAQPAQEPPAAEREPELSADLIGRNGFAIQMATFSSAQRAAQSVQQLRTSGYRAYDRAVSLRDGTDAHVVFLGPFATFESASLELVRARELPDYSAERIIALE